MAHINHFVVSEQVEIFDRTGAVAQLHLCGPQATAILEAMVPTLQPLEHLQHTAVDSLRIVRHDRLGLPGYDLICPASDAAGLMDRVVKAGGVLAGSATFNILRIEAGIPMDGIDIDAERFVVEVGRTGQAICYTKGCYLGQEPIVMARDRGHLNRMLLGLKSEAPEPLQPGTKVTQDGQEVGQVTSSVAFAADRSGNRPGVHQTRQPGTGHKSGGWQLSSGCCHAAVCGEMTIRMLQVQACSNTKPKDATALKSECNVRAPTRLDVRYLSHASPTPSRNKGIGEGQIVDVAAAKNNPLTRMADNGDIRLSMAGHATRLNLASICDDAADISGQAAPSPQVVPRRCEFRPARACWRRLGASGPGFGFGRSTA